MQKIETAAVLVIFALALAGCISGGNGQQVQDGESTAQKQSLAIITYDGFNSEYGLGRVILPKFEKACNCTVRVLASGDVGWVAAKSVMQKENPDADVVLGLDNSYRGEVSKHDLFEPYMPAGYGLLSKDVKDGDYRFIPYDYGFVALMYDSEKTGVYPKSLEEMADARFRGRIVMPDPLSSSTGRTFVFWAASEYGNGTKDYFSRLKPSILAVTPGWTEAYGMFTGGEAPYVISYTTSPAYHLAFENSTRYKAVLFPRMYKQVEYVSLLKNSRNKALAEKFIDFMLSPEVQAEIPLGNFMYPSVSGTALPDAFSVVGYPEGIAAETEDTKWLDDWKEVYRQ